ncbi:MAG: chemotaxis response regulator protein-glutamate methylesterase [Eubacterium sp.]|nr:chemotaxis response regulator protein-glutamate methylesterase [Eubacterium sp.]
MKKNILVVDDSALMRRILCDIINADSNYEVTETCRNGQEALDKLRTKTYDAMLLDVNMPVMDGIKLLEELQKEKIQTTIIMVSTLTTAEADVTIRAMELGATDFVTKPENVMDAKGKDFSDNLLGIINAVLLSGNYKRSFVTPKVKTDIKPSVSSADSSSKSSSAVPTAKGSKLIALASSTGGPKALQSVIPYLPKNMDAPLVLVQHMPAGFTASMANRLNELSEVEVKEAEDGDVLKKGWVYIAPGGKHIRVVAGAAGHTIKLSDEPPIGGLRPCADIMYESLESSKFDSICCVVLTGMGADGTKGINGLKKARGGIFTIAQNAETCVVYGMPKAIAESGAVNEVVPLEEVAKTIIKNVGVK